MSREMIVEKTNTLLEGHCAAELKEAAKAWLAALDTEKEEEATDKYILELEDAITSVDDLIAFMGSDAAKAAMGPEMAEKLLAHGKEIKANGGDWCDCPACTRAIEILGLFDDEDELGKMILDFEDGTSAECDVVCVYEMGEELRIVLLSPEDEVLIYGYSEDEEGNFELFDLDDEAFEAASEEFDKLIAE